MASAAESAPEPGHRGRATGANVWLAAKEADASSRRPGVLGLLPVLDRIDQETLAAAVDRSRLSTYTAAQERDVDEDAGSGNMASVAKITYTDGTVVAFKKDVTTGAMDSLDGKAHGIPDTNAALYLAGRSVANSLAEMLGLNNVPNTSYAMHGGEVGTTQGDGGAPSVKMRSKVKTPQSSASNGDIAPLDQWKFDGTRAALQLLDAGSDQGIQRAWADGDLWVTESVPASGALPDLTDPNLQKSLADAHLFDLLTGQLDRNPGNFVFGEDETGNLRANLIDNDLSFAPGTRLGDDADPPHPPTSRASPISWMPDIIASPSPRRI